MWVLLLSCFFICNNTPLNSAIETVNNRFSFTEASYDKKIKIKFAKNKFAAIIICNAMLGEGYMAIMTQGYGASTVRNHVAEIMKGVYFSYEVLNDETGIMITYSFGSGSYSVSVFMIEGNLISVA